MDTNTAAVIGAVCSAAGIGLGVVNMMMAVAKERRAARTAFDEDRARWTLIMREAGADKVRRAVVSYGGGPGPLYFIERMDVVGPRGARIAKLVRGERPLLGAAPVSPSPDGFYRRLAWSAHLPTEVSFLMPSKKQVTRHELELFVEVPARPWWSWSAETRLRISLTMEESAGLRRRKTITITSRPMLWAASSQTITT